MGASILNRRQRVNSRTTDLLKFGLGYLQCAFWSSFYMQYAIVMAVATVPDGEGIIMEAGHGVVEVVMMISLLHTTINLEPDPNHLDQHLDQNFGLVLQLAEQPVQQPDMRWVAGTADNRPKGRQEQGRHTTITQDPTIQAKIGQGHPETSPLQGLALDLGLQGDDEGKMVDESHGINSCWILHASL